MCSHPDHVVHTVNITVSNVDPNGSEGEAVLLPGAVDGDGRVQDIHCGAEVTAGGGITRRGVGREGAGRHGARQRGGSVLLH